MKYRKLRIAWSVAWGVVAVLSVALWVRSYWRFDGLWWKIPVSISVTSTRGNLYFNEVFEFDDHVPALAVRPIERNVLGFVFRFASAFDRDVKNLRGTGRGGSMPYLVALFVSTILAALPWFPFRRFSLRTLLIATTLVAVGLGLIVWLR